MKYILTLILLLPTYIFAEQTVINDYNDARDNYFYDKLYIGTVGESLYRVESLDGQGMFEANLTVNEIKA